MVTERNTDPGDTYEQSGSNFGIGSMNDCEIKDNAKVAKVIHEGASNKAEMNPSIVNQINFIVTSGCIPKSGSSKQTTHKNGHETYTAPVAFSVVGSIGSDDVKKLKSILRLLRQLSEDITIDIEDIELGSIRLILNGSPEGLERLEALFKSGKLTEIEGITVENVQFVTTETSKGGEGTQATERKRLAFTIAGSLEPDDIAKLKAAIIETSNNDPQLLARENLPTIGYPITTSAKDKIKSRVVITTATYGTINQSGNFGIGIMKGGTIEAGAKVAAVINEAEQQNLTEAAAQIQQLLEQLEKSYPTNTTAGKMAIATEAISQIESNPTLVARILSALKAGGISTFEQFLNHPAASFVIGALADWQQTKEGFTDELRQDCYDSESQNLS